ncbi:hypothetical protein ADICYQ_0652 [Cyclobacterium qasimii M12-11B]|uniref:Uncharacterized protein n=3 Tax=Cyclobacterium qasimii TaxID=1350429 RepID=S7VM85_9BACT|nr:hypothetical protein ADICYQ_0652 [Cyclobacterium qasimii M12-11B]
MKRSLARTLPHFRKMKLRILIILILGLQISCSKKASRNETLVFNESEHSPESGMQSTNQESNNISEKETEDDCIFDLTTQSDEFIQHIPEFKNYTWNDSTKTATILLQNGDTLYAQRGGCYHFGISGKLVKLNDDHSIDNIDHWLGEAKWISKRILDDSDYQELEQMIVSKNYDLDLDNDRIYIAFKGHNYSEWYLTVERLHGNTIIDTGYYFD